MPSTTIHHLCSSMSTHGLGCIHTGTAAYRGVSTEGEQPRQYCGCHRARLLPRNYQRRQYCRCRYEQERVETSAESKCRTNLIALMVETMRLPRERAGGQRPVQAKAECTRRGADRERRRLTVCTQMRTTLRVPHHQYATQKVMTYKAQ